MFNNQCNSHFINSKRICLLFQAIISSVQQIPTVYSYFSVYFPLLDFGFVALHEQLPTTSTKTNNCKLQCVTLKRQMCSHPSPGVSLHHSECTIPSRGGLGEVVGLRLHNAPCQLRVSLLSGICRVERSKGQRRRGVSLNQTPVIWALLKTGQ